MARVFEGQKVLHTQSFRGVVKQLPEPAMSGSYETPTKSINTGSQKLGRSLQIHINKIIRYSFLCSV